MNLKRIFGIILLAVSLALLVLFILPELGVFEFRGVRPPVVSYSQPYEGHAVWMILAIVGCVVSFLGGLFLIGISRNRR